jgi:protein dithiol:quinone oxidoreductase
MTTSASRFPSPLSALHLHRRFFWVSLAAVAVAMEAFALISQHAFGLQPCNECIYIRAGVLGLGIAGVLGAISPQTLLLRWTACVLVLVSLSGSLWRAWTLVDIEKQVSEGAALGCKRFKGFPDWLPLERLVPEMFEPRGKCGEIVGAVLGPSFAGWTLVGLVALAGLVVLAFVQSTLSKE